MTIIGSVLIYPSGAGGPPGGLAYVDALFFASGSATQSGLNTVDINRLSTYQQIVLLMVPLLCNPIVIHGFVVLVRLYWFEKRFQGLVRGAKEIRRTRTRSRTKSEAKQDRDPAREERGVQGRAITVVRDETGHANGHKIEDAKSKVAGKLTDSESSSNSSTTHREQVGWSNNNDADAPESPGFRNRESSLGLPLALQREIMFADEVDDIKPSLRRISNLERLPEERSKEQHIAFIENQRNPKDTSTLRIPGPRDFDRGDIPRALDEEDGADLSPQLTRATSTFDAETERHRRSNSRDTAGINGDDEVAKPHITIDAPLQRRERADTLESRTKPSDKRENTMLGLRRRGRNLTFNSFLSNRTQERDQDPMPYLSYAPTMGRNSTFIDLTEEQREELGGIEYRSLKTLAWLLVIYFVGFMILGLVVLLPWILYANSSYVPGAWRTIPLEDGISPAWWGVFTPWSMFTDLGFTLTPDSMVSFQKATAPLLLGTLLIIAGNTGFPCFLRLEIWIASKLVPRASAVWDELRFLLDHPRRCFTLLFPASATWWLFAILVMLNGIDLIFFVVLDLKDTTVTSLPRWFQFLDGLFQAASTRTAGFACVNLADLHPAIQVSYLIMMYISVFPIAISMRRTNVYEEKSLGVYAGAESTDDNDTAEPSYVGSHLRRQLSFDLWYVFLGFFLICIIEGDRIENVNDYAFTQFSILFEIISAYGTVGLSLGYPGVNASFSAEFRTLSKLIIIAMQIRGRHRGLPYALDRAILLPSENLHKKEQEEAERRRMARRNSQLSQMIMGDGPNVDTSPGADNGLTRKHTNSAYQNIKDRGLGLSRVVSGAFSTGPSKHRKRRLSV